MKDGDQRSGSTNKGRSITISAFCVLIGLLSLSCWNCDAQSPTDAQKDFAAYAMKLRQKAILRIERTVIITSAQPVSPSPDASNGTGMSMFDRAFNLFSGSIRYPWKQNIVTTVFWIGEHASPRNPVPNNRSSWDHNWSLNYGGYDNPNIYARRNFIPLKFVPRQNPFYVALPYNDISGSHTKPEARQVVPWFKEVFVRDGQSVLQGRWVAVRRGNRVCYAQWEDCGPFRTDHWQYVFGKDRPKPNANQGAGLDVSPAVRDYLSIGNKELCDWKFVDLREIPPGPWAMYGNNNPFVNGHQQNNERFARRDLPENALVQE